MSETPIRGLPEADEPHEVLGSMHYVLYSLGRELGERYDSHLRAAIGPQWADALGKLRHQRINKFDAHFVMSEPLKHPDSPTRACLPSGGAFYNLLEEALDVRHAWAHQDIVSPDLDSLERSVSTMHQLASKAQLKLGKLCSEIRKRIKAIRNGSYPPAGEAVAADRGPTVDELMAELEQARAAAEAMQAEVAAAQALLDEAAEAGQAQADMEQRLAAALSELEQANIEKEKLEFVIEGMANTDHSEPSADGWVDVIPGHPWPGALPGRKVTMMTLNADLFDEATGQRVAQEFSSAAAAVIADWKQTVAPKAAIYLSEAGQAVTYIHGTAVYLGSLGEQREADGSQLAGFFVPHSYTLRLNGQIQDRTTDGTLADVNPDAADEVASRLLEVVPTGGRLRVTTTGAVARHSDGKWIEVARVTSDEWFPGHLP
jgi:hypothetical protein